MLRAGLLFLILCTSVAFAGKKLEARHIQIMWAIPWSERESISDYSFGEFQGALEDAIIKAPGLAETLGNEILVLRIRPSKESRKDWIWDLELEFPNGAAAQMEAVTTKPGYHALIDQLAKPVVEFIATRGLSVALMNPESLSADVRWFAGQLEAAYLEAKTSNSKVLKTFLDEIGKIGPPPRGGGRKARKFMREASLKLHSVRDKVKAWSGDLKVDVFKLEPLELEVPGTDIVPLDPNAFLLLEEAGAYLSSESLELQALVERAEEIGAKVKLAVSEIKIIRTPKPPLPGRIHIGAEFLLVKEGKALEKVTFSIAHNFEKEPSIIGGHIEEELVDGLGEHGILIITACERLLTAP
jgi:hypothetical protein